MKTLSRHWIEETAVQALERFALLNVWPAETEVETACAHHVQVHFAGDGESGRLVLSANDGFVTDLAGGLLGVETGQVNVVRDGEDALGELGNTLAGRVVELLGGVDRPICLSLPERVDHVRRLPEPDFRVWLQSERGVLCISIMNSA